MVNKTKPHLWIFNHYAVTPDLPGATRHFDFGRELVKRGYQVTVFAADFNHLLLQPNMKLGPRKKWKLENVDGVNFVWLKTFSYQQNNWRRIINICSYFLQASLVSDKIAKKIGRPDVIIGSTVHPLAPLLALRLAKKFQAKFIGEIRDLWPQSLQEMGVLSRKSLTTIILHWLNRLIYPRAKEIIVLSPTINEYLLSIGCLPEKIHIIPNGVDLNYYPVESNIKASKKFTVLYAGALSLIHALEPALEAAKIIQEQNIDNIQLVMVGSGPQKTRLEQLIRDWQLTNVSLEPAVPKQDIPKLLLGADALLLMENNLIYGSSNKLMTYLAAGKPIIFSTFVDNKPLAQYNIVKDVNCGLVTSSQDAKKLAETIIQLYRLSKSDREQMGARGRAYAEAHHAIPLLVDQLEPLLTN
ncbi:MAG TPA: glycosyltransferase WbuB [Candidatus Jacksonbacteria bacterium]|nr:MAG: Glycosyl transferase group 1 [Parcubacteria group bacterium GW2011_GWC2_44_22]OGY75342.1 MAG: hypothetical protein A2295_04145 [Candidatus Jacksonbacteria bacterium RIFOXYB2_FULL_44_15]OGY82048.1 MAG: hypothetical protein A2550_00560 [Candidatus Jacksonbacteria bacterium RIFOXYD2_FULL_43_21]HBH45847.1 glycosyltransferase WbuB [Candidatus Jacksonbacteria bacterium]HCC50448.1 glycosyltransferase WbuB [Candidatus Jacksonbacteria bacterium]